MLLYKYKSLSVEVCSRHSILEVYLQVNGMLETSQGPRKGRATSVERARVTSFLPLISLLSHLPSRSRIIYFASLD
jgi:hypothetical protein